MNLQQNIPLLRVLNRLDGYFAKNDLQGAGRHLETWLGEAAAVGDTKAQLLLLNELLGVARKAGDREKAFHTVEKVLALTEGDRSVSSATCRLNCATVFTAFGDHESAIRYYAEAKAVYESAPDLPAEKLGSLYNNMAMAYLPLKEYARARELSEKALSVMSSLPGTAAEQAITWLNTANIAEAETGLEAGWDEIERCLANGKALLDDSENAADSDYAFACTKCAPVFDYYGYFFYAAKLKERAKEIYERS